MTTAHHNEYATHTIYLEHGLILKNTPITNDAHLCRCALACLYVTSLFMLVLIQRQKIKLLFCHKLKTPDYTLVLEHFHS